MKDILINILFLLVILFFTQLLSENHTKNLTGKTKIYVIFFISMVSIYFSMTFSISLNHGQFRYDIRAVPFILGSLFGGPVVSVLLYLSILIYRTFLGIDLGFYGAVINYGLLTIMLLIFSRRFLNSTLKQKLLVALYLTWFHVLLSYFVYSYLFVSGLQQSIFIQSSFIKLAIIMLMILTTEKMKQNQQFRVEMEDFEKMEMASHLSASISHEVRNGLTGASGFIQLLSNMETNSQKSRYIQIALEELERTENIIRDFLTFAKPAPGDLKDINLELLILNTLDIIKPHANMSSVEIHKYLSPFWIRGDEKMVQQSFLNIFKNAIDAMGSGGRLEIHMIFTRNELLIKIKDTGVGMTKEQMERLGKPYFTTKGQNGTGLGMMVSYRVIEELKGKIKVHSEEGNGTTFTVHLPRSIDLHKLVDHPLN